MSDSRDVPKAIPVVDVLATDTPCTSCGYNLRGLRHDQACPECGAEVWRSCQGDLLRFADPEWLKRLRLGVWLLLASLAFSVVSRLMIEALSAVSLIPAPASIGLLIWLGESILGISAAILITSPEPALSLEEQPSSLRRVTRLAVLLSIGSDLWEVDLLPTSNRLLTVTITALGYAAAIVWYFGEFVYLRRLALRIPDDALARRTRVVMWGFFAGTAMAGVVALTAVGAFGGGPVGTPVIGFVVIGCVGVVLVLVFLIAYVHMLYRYIRAFRTAIDLAVIAPYLKAPLSQGPQNPAR